MRITTNAAQHLADGLARASEIEGKNVCFRIVPSANEGRYRLAFGRPNAEDQTFEMHGTVVLAMAPDIASQCEDKVLDVQEQADGTRQLSINGP